MKAQSTGMQSKAPVFAGSFRIAGSEQAVALFAPTFVDSGLEQLRVAHLDAMRELIALRLHGGGGTRTFDIPVRAITQEALVLGTHGLLIAHNHPSGDPSPSRDDIAATRALTQAIAPLGVHLYDHLIFGGGGWRSLHALGLL